MSDRLRVVEMPLPTIWQRRQTAALAKLGVEVRYVEGFYPTSYLPWFQLPRALASRYDVFHVHWIPFWNAALLRAFLRVVPRSRPLVWQFHNLWPHKPQFGDEATDIAWTKRCWERADARLVHSALNVGDFGAHGMHSADVVPLGNLHGAFPATATREEARARTGFAQEATVVGFFGPTGPYKGVDTFVEAVLRTPGVTGYVFGHCPDKALAADLAGAASRSKGRLVVDLARVGDADLQHAFRSCDAVAVPYKRITTSGSVFFPAAFGIPVVGVPQGNIPEVVVDGKTGWITEGVDGFARAFADVAARKDELPAMGERFYADVARRFDWDTMAKKTVAVYRRVLDQKTLA